MYTSDNTLEEKPIKRSRNKHFFEKKNKFSDERNN